MPAVRSVSRPTLRASLLAILAVCALAISACSAAAADRSVLLPLRTLNGSGVTGTVRLVMVDEHRTRIEVRVDPAGHHDMPAHIHPGTCSTLTPQPKYPLENVRDGVSTTEIEVSLDELVTLRQALNVHDSNDNMSLFTACAELGGTEPAPTDDPNASPSATMNHEGMPGMSMSAEPSGHEEETPGYSMPAEPSGS